MPSLVPGDRGDRSVLDSAAIGASETLQCPNRQVGDEALKDKQLRRPRHQVFGICDNCDMHGTCDICCSAWHTVVEATRRTRSPQRNNVCDVIYGMHGTCDICDMVCDMVLTTSVSWLDAVSAAATVRGVRSVAAVSMAAG